MPEQPATIRGAATSSEVNLGFTARARRCWRPSAACSARTRRASTAARCASTSRASSTSWPRATCRARPSRSSTTTPCRASPAGSARRRRSAKARCLRGKKGEPVAIGYLERFVADWAMAHPRRLITHVEPASTGQRVAIVGSGPAGLTAAGELAKAGHEVTIFEAFHTAGRRADLRHPRVPPAQGHRPAGGRPPARRTGVKIEVNAIIGKTCTLRRAARAVRRRLHRRRRRPAGLHGRARARTSRASTRPTST